MIASTVGFQHKSRACRRATQNGSSLVEVLIGIAIAASLSGLVAAAYFVTDRSVSTTSGSLAASNSAFRTSARFADDVAGVGPVADVMSGFVTSGEPGCRGDPAVVRLLGPASPPSSPTVRVRSYEITGTLDAPTLVRSECTGATLAEALANPAGSTEVVPNLAATGGATASCNGEAFSGAECDFVALSILTTTGFSYTLEASVRVSRTPTVVTLPNPSPFIASTYGRYSVNVPAYKTVTFELWGGSGGGGQNGDSNGDWGGNGGTSTLVIGTIAAKETPYTLHVALGEGGRGGFGAGRSGGRSAYGPGGDGGARGKNQGGDGGGGGGASAISDDSAFAGSILIVAPGGGGGGGASTRSSANGGAGGGPITVFSAPVSTSSGEATVGIDGVRGSDSGALGGSRGGSTAPGTSVKSDFRNLTRWVSEAGGAGSGSTGGKGGNAEDDEHSGGGGGGGGGQWGAGGGEGGAYDGANHGGGGGGSGSAIAVGVLAPTAEWGFAGGARGSSGSDRDGRHGTDGKVVLRFS
jgi:hypothetical protein